MSHVPGTEATSSRDAREFSSIPSLILDSLGEGVYGLDLEGKTTFVNRAASEKTGWSPEELIGRIQHDLIHHTRSDGSAYPKHECPIHQTLVDGEVRKVDDEVFWRRDGSFFPVAYTATPVVVDGRVTGAVVVFRDMSRSVEAIKAIQQQEARHRALLDALPDSIIRLRLDGEVLELQLPSGSADPHDVGAAIGMNIRDLVGSELAEFALAHSRLAVETGRMQQFEYERPRDDGVSINEARFVAAGDDEVVAVVRDVTEARRAENALRESEHRFRAIFDSMFQFIGLLKPDGTLLEANEAALEFAGITLEDVVERPFWETHWWQVSDETRDDLRQAVKRAAGGQFVRFEVDVLGAGGHMATIDFSLKPVVNDDEDVVLLIAEGRNITEQKDSERALKHSEQLLAGITNTACDGIVALRVLRDGAGHAVDFEWLFANPKSAAFTGTDSSSLKGKRLLETLTDKLGRDLFDQCMLVLNAGDVDEREFYYERPDGEVYFRSTAVKFGEGCVVTLRDVTVDRVREERLRSSRLQLSRAQEIAHLGSWEWDPQSGELQWSDELYRIYGLEPGDPVSLERYLEKVVPEDRERVRESVQMALEKGGAFSFEERIRRTDGTERVLASSGEVLMDGDGYVTVIGVCHDITDRRRAERQLRESEHRFRQLAEQMTDLVSLHDRDGTYVYASPSAERILGFSPHDLIGKKPADLMHPDDVRRLAEIGGSAMAGVPDDTVVRMRNNEGDWIWLEFLTNVIRSDDDEVLSFQASARDVTERVEAQQAAARSAAVLAQRNRELQDFAYVASHDLQEPLRKIRAFADLLNDDFGARLDEDGRFYLERVQDSAARMSTLISDLLAFSRVSSRAKPFENVALNDIAADVISDLEYLIRDVKGRVLVDELPVIDADRTQMRQLIQNLVGNGLKFSRPGEVPVVRVTSRMVHGVLHSGAEEQDLVELSVADNGIGFDEKYLDRIFTPFQRLHTRTEYAGTGMGLAICRRIVERHGGTITATSRPGVGSSFVVRLPLKRN